MWSSNHVKHCDQMLQKYNLCQEILRHKFTPPPGYSVSCLTSNQQVSSMKAPNTHVGGLSGIYGLLTLFRNSSDRVTPREGTSSWRIYLSPLSSSCCYAFQHLHDSFNFFKRQLNKLKKHTSSSIQEVTLYLH